MSRPQIKVIRIPQKDSDIQRLKQLLWHGLHRRLRPYRHEHRRFDRPVRQRQRRAPSVAGSPANLKRERHLLIVASSYSSASPGSRSRKTEGISRRPCRTAAISAAFSETLYAI